MVTFRAEETSKVIWYHSKDYFFLKSQISESNATYTAFFEGSLSIASKVSFIQWGRGGTTVSISVLDIHSS